MWLPSRRPGRQPHRQRRKTAGSGVDDQAIVAQLSVDPVGELAALVRGCSAQERLFACGHGRVVVVEQPLACGVAVARDAGATCKLEGPAQKGRAYCEARANRGHQYKTSLLQLAAFNRRIHR